MVMEQEKKYTRNKGGRPKKAIKKDQQLGVKCSLIERKVIEAKSKMAGLSVSEYLRKLGMDGKIDRREKTLPKEVLQCTGTLNHFGANLNQIAKKRNGFDELNAFERAELKVLSDSFKQIAIQLKNYLK